MRECELLTYMFLSIAQACFEVVTPSGLKQSDYIVGDGIDETMQYELILAFPVEIGWL